LRGMGRGLVSGTADRDFASLNFRRAGRRRERNIFFVADGGIQRVLSDIGRHDHTVAGKVIADFLGDGDPLLPPRSTEPLAWSHVSAEISTSPIDKQPNSLKSVAGRTRPVHIGRREQRGQLRSPGNAGRARRGIRIALSTVQGILVSSTPLGTSFRQSVTVGGRPPRCMPWQM